MELRKIKVQLDETVEEYVEEFIHVKEAQGKSERTIKDYQTQLNKFIKASSNSMDYDTLNEDVLNFFAKIPNTSPAVYNQPYQCLKAFFNWCVDNNHLPKNPITANKLTKRRDDGNIKPVEIEDIKRFLDSFDKTIFSGYRNYIMTLVMLDTGIRTSEIRRLKHGAYDANAKQIFISKEICKTSRDRILFLSDSTARALNKYLKIMPEGFSEFLFPTSQGREFNSKRLGDEFKKNCIKSGVKFTPYQLRHTFATYFVENGGNLFALQDLMGHSNSQMTKRYTEVSNRQKQEQHQMYTPMNLLQGTPRITKIKKI